MVAIGEDQPDEVAIGGGQLVEVLVAVKWMIVAVVVVAVVEERVVATVEGEPNQVEILMMQQNREIEWNLGAVLRLAALQYLEAVQIQVVYCLAVAQTLVEEQNQVVYCLMVAQFRVAVQILGVY